MDEDEFWKNIAIGTEILIYIVFSPILIPLYLLGRLFRKKGD